MFGSHSYFVNQRFMQTTQTASGPQYLGYSVDSQTGNCCHSKLHTPTSTSMVYNCTSIHIWLRISDSFTTSLRSGPTQFYNQQFWEIDPFETNSSFLRLIWGRSDHHVSQWLVFMQNPQLNQLSITCYFLLDYALVMAEVQMLWSLQKPTVFIQEGDSYFDNS